MKKSTLYTGIGFMLFGIACIALALTTEFKIEGLLWGFGGAGIGPGAMMIWKYIHWSRPENSNLYREKLKQEKIEMRDERKIIVPLAEYKPIL